MTPQTPNDLITLIKKLRAKDDFLSQWVEKNQIAMSPFIIYQEPEKEKPTKMPKKNGSIQKWLANKVKHMSDAQSIVWENEKINTPSKCSNLATTLTTMDLFLENMETLVSYPFWDNKKVKFLGIYPAIHLNENTGLGCLDIDNCGKIDKFGFGESFLVDSRKSNIVWPLMRYIQEGFIEVSCSGQGLHVWNKIDHLPNSTQCKFLDGKIEFYYKKRFIIINLSFYHLVFANEKKSLSKENFKYIRYSNYKQQDKAQLEAGTNPWILDDFF